MTHNIYVLVSCVQQSDSVKQTYIIPHDLLKNIYLAASGLSCGPRDLSFGVWDLAPQSGIEPRSPALEHRVFTTGPRGKSLTPYKVLVAKSCLTLTTLWAVACQAPLSMEISRQEYWNGLPFPTPGNRPNPEIKPRSPALQADSLPSEPPGKPLIPYILYLISPSGNILQKHSTTSHQDAGIKTVKIQASSSTTRIPHIALW